MPITNFLNLADVDKAVQSYFANEQKFRLNELTMQEALEKRQREKGLREAWADAQEGGEPGVPFVDEAGEFMGVGTPRGLYEVAPNAGRINFNRLQEEYVKRGYGPESLDIRSKLSDVSKKEIGVEEEGRKLFGMLASLDPNDPASNNAYQAALDRFEQIPSLSEHVGKLRQVAPVFNAQIAKMFRDQAITAEKQKDFGLKERELNIRQQRANQLAGPKSGGKETAIQSKERILNEIQAEEKLIDAALSDGEMDTEEHVLRKKQLQDRRILALGREKAASSKTGKLPSRALQGDIARIIEGDPTLGKLSQSDKDLIGFKIGSRINELREADPNLSAEEALDQAITDTYQKYINEGEKSNWFGPGPFKFSTDNPSVKRSAPGQKPVVTPQPQTAKPVNITNDEEYNRLPSGSHFIGPDGKERIKP